MSWRQTTAYRKWRIRVIRKFPLCVICGSIKHRQAHHISNGAHHQSIRFDVNNGVTLCRSCHSKFHNDFIGSFRMKCTKKDWLNFISLISYIKTINLV